MGQFVTQKALFCTEEYTNYQAIIKKCSLLYTVNTCLIHKKGLHDLVVSYMQCNSCYMYLQAWECIVNNTVSGLWSSWPNLKRGCLFHYYLR